jgi:hypothetical protein
MHQVSKSLWCMLAGMKFMPCQGTSARGRAMRYVVAALVLQKIGHDKEQVLKNGRKERMQAWWMEERTSSRMCLRAH